MNLTLNTLVADLSVALKALEHYQSGRFRDAIEDLQSVLDFEPQNWDARLMLAASYYKTQQWSAAYRTFQYIAANAVDNEIRLKASEGMQVTQSKLTANRCGLPAEFGCDTELLRAKYSEKISWL
ncbi:MAG: tetratricopeptide repeat protein [Candidatus Obscuribacterales bacterium]|nr:tetratricopeptide repeat protein [Candidatus Obscuribacterales bacterium]